MCAGEEERILCDSEGLSKIPEGSFDLAVIYEELRLDAMELIPIVTSKVKEGGR